MPIDISDFGTRCTARGLPWQYYYLALRSSPAARRPCLLPRGFKPGWTRWIRPERRPSSTACARRQRVATPNRCTISVLPKCQQDGRGIGYARGQSQFDKCAPPAGIDLGHFRNFLHHPVILSLFFPLIALKQKTPNMLIY